MVPANDSTVIYIYNSNNQLTSEGIDTLPTDGTPDPATATTYNYDANGSQTKVTTPSGTKYYLYDLRNRMVGISLDDDDNNATDSGETEYVYDDDGVRVSQLTHGATNSAIVYLNDPDNPTGYSKTLEKRTGASIANASLNTSYILGERVEGQKDSTGVVYFIRDGHGSDRLLTDSNEAAVANNSYDYTAFGDAIGFNPNATTTRTTELFGGDGVYDPASGFTYHLARWRSGFRFTSRDTYVGHSEDPMSLHKYLYAFANPVTWADPSGYMPNATELLNGFYDDDMFTHSVVSAVESINDPFKLIGFYGWFTMKEYGAVEQFVRMWADATTAMEEALLETYMSIAQVCFQAGTQVIVGVNKDRSYITRSIEDLRPGDVVLSKNEHDPKGDLDSKAIVNVFKNVSDHIRVLQIKAENTNIETFRTTDNHEFWVEGLGWRKAYTLSVGDQVSRPDRSSATVVSTVREAHPKGIAVYNIEVQEDHTYFVTDGHGDQVGVWVHNTGDCNNDEQIPAGEFAERDALAQMLDDDMAEISAHDRDFYSAPHKNSLDSLAPAEGYILVDRVSREPLRYGMTTQGKARYSQAQLERLNADMVFVEEGSVREMRSWENRQILDYFASTGRRPPLNFNFH